MADVKTKETPLPPAPECEKLLKVSKESNVIGEFLDWMESEKKLVFAKWGMVKPEYSDGFEREGLLPEHINKEKLLADFYKIDLNKVETERRALLDHLRKQQ